VEPTPPAFSRDPSDEKSGGYTSAPRLKLAPLSTEPFIHDPPDRAIALENHPSPSNPLGVKGAGEGAIIPVGGLIANAVAAALSSVGAEPNELPLSPPRVWRLANPS
jgi:hypothetical protein